LGTAKAMAGTDADLRCCFFRVTWFIALSASEDATSVPRSRTLVFDGTLTDDLSRREPRWISACDGCDALDSTTSTCFKFGKERVLIGDMDTGESATR
jgi:hypothetical protein